MRTIVTRTDKIAKNVYFLLGRGIKVASFDLWLILRGLKILPINIRTHVDNTMISAEYLSEHHRYQKFSIQVTNTSGLLNSRTNNRWIGGVV